MSEQPPIEPNEVPDADRGAGVASTLLGAGAFVAAAAALAFALSVSDNAHRARWPVVPTRAEGVQTPPAAQPGREGVVVVMYSTAWCGSCVAARAYMDRQGITYVDHDIDDDASAREAMQRLNPRGSVPTLDVDGQILVGFGPQYLESALDKAARKRAGI